MDAFITEYVVRAAFYSASAYANGFAFGLKCVKRANNSDAPKRIISALIILLFHLFELQIEIKCFPRTIDCQRKRCAIGSLNCTLKIEK